MNELKCKANTCSNFTDGGICYKGINPEECATSMTHGLFGWIGALLRNRNELQAKIKELEKEIENLKKENSDLSLRANAATEIIKQLYGNLEYKNDIKTAEKYLEGFKE